jgi:hypothetical protein
MLHQTSDAVFYHVFGTSVTAAPDTWAIRDERVAAPAKPPTQVADLAVRSDGSVIAVYGDSAGLRYRIRTRAKDAAPARACRVCSSHGKPPGYFQRSRAGIPDRKGDHPTPDNYPLTLNALTAACNRTSNRDPVMNLDEATVSTSLDDLARRSLARGVHRSDSRVMRYRHRMAETLNLHPAEIAAMCVLMLRGHQTVGEIRTRNARMFEFNDLAHVDVTLQALMTLSLPLVAQLPRRPGQKEVRYAQLLSGEPQSSGTEQPPPMDPEEPGRIEILEQEVAFLRTELAELRARPMAISRLVC